MMEPHPGPREFDANGPLTRSSTDAQASRGTSPATQEDKDDCESKDIARELRGCTRLIQDTRRSQKDQSSALYNRGNAYLNSQDYYRAITDFTEAIQLNPSNVVVFINRGAAFTKI